MVLLLDAVVGPGAYRVEFVELGSRVHSRIRLLAPDLVVLCMRIDETAGFQLLTMLKLDSLTRDIPVLTFTTEREGEEYPDAAAQSGDEDEFLYQPPRAAFPMN